MYQHILTANLKIGLMWVVWANSKIDKCGWLMTQNWVSQIVNSFGFVTVCHRKLFMKKFV